MTPCTARPPTLSASRASSGGSVLLGWAAGRSAVLWRGGRVARPARFVGSGGVLRCPPGRNQARIQRRGAESAEIAEKEEFLRFARPPSVVPTRAARSAKTCLLGELDRSPLFLCDKNTGERKAQTLPGLCWCRAMPGRCHPLATTTKRHILRRLTTNPALHACQITGTL